MIRIVVMSILLATGSAALAGPLPSAVGRGVSFYSSVPTAYMDDPRRVEWQLPDRVIEALGLKAGAAVADIGAGTGFFTLRLARRVGPEGTVYAVDVDERMISLITARASREGLTNVRGLHAPEDDPGLPEASVDLAFICDTYLFFGDRADYLRRLRERLRPSGRVAIVSFNYQAEIPGAPPRHRMVPKDRVVSEMTAAGFVLEADHTFLPYQDFLVFALRQPTPVR
jgi:ubiquinone/menaquinone biosynthesis C-methylase UbiE